MKNLLVKGLPLPIIDRFENMKDAGGPASFLLLY